MQTHLNGLRIYTQFTAYTPIQRIACNHLLNINDNERCVLTVFFSCSFIRSHSVLLLLRLRFITIYFVFLFTGCVRYTPIVPCECVVRCVWWARVCVCLDSYGIRCFEWETVPRVSMTMSICNECYMCYGLLILVRSACRVLRFVSAVPCIAYSLQLETCKRDPVLKSRAICVCVELAMPLRPPNPKWIVLFLRRV